MRHEALRAADAAVAAAKRTEQGWRFDWVQGKYNVAIARPRKDGTAVLYVQRRVETLDEVIEYLDAQGR
jgi:hypothetical protein